MSSAYRFAVIASFVLFAASNAIRANDLRVCADPNNLPFSNEKGSGFENEIAKLVAHDLHRNLSFAWTPQRGEFLKKSINDGKCDLIVGVPSAIDDLETTIPYYRSSFVFVSRRDRTIEAQSFDDPILRKSTIGVQLLQHEGATIPAAQLLINHGLMGNIRWYRIFPDFYRSNPSFAVMEAVQKGEIDTAIVWGPVAGYYTQTKARDLVLSALPADPAKNDSLTFDISMGVRHGDEALLRQLNAFLKRNHDELCAVLKRYGVPDPSQSVRGVAEKKVWNDKS
jgi:mxaJ protein